MAALGRCYQILAIIGFRHDSNKCAFAEFSKLSPRKSPYEPQRRGERTGEKTVAKVVSELPIPSPALFTVSDAARVLRRSPSTIYRHCALGQLPASRVGNQLWIGPDDLARFLQRQRRVAKSKH